MLPKLIKLTLAPVLFYFAVALYSHSALAGENQHQLNHGDSSVKIWLSNDFNPTMQKALINWADYISSALLQVYGRWPRAKWEIAVTPVSASSSDLIPWAQVKRGDPDRVEFFTTSAATASQLKATWTSYHELSHLLIPYRGWGDMWFSEGLATYYQNILQVRIEQLTEQQMWKKLHHGFLRGRAQSEFSEFTLQALSSNMRENGAFMRVYWSGAWYFLNADLRLRLQSGGMQSLDTALDKLNRCCAEQKMSVRQMVKKLDALSKVALFEPLYYELIHSTQIPAFEPLFAELGINVVDEELTLQTTGPGAALRARLIATKNL